MKGFFANFLLVSTACFENYCCPTLFFGSSTQLKCSISSSYVPFVCTFSRVDYPQPVWMGHRGRPFHRLIHCNLKNRLEAWHCSRRRYLPDHHHSSWWYFHTCDTSHRDFFCDNRRFSNWERSQEDFLLCMRAPRHSGPINWLWRRPCVKRFLWFFALSSVSKVSFKGNPKTIKIFGRN